MFTHYENKNMKKLHSPAIANNEFAPTKATNAFFKFIVIAQSLGIAAIFITALIFFSLLEVTP